MTALSAIPISFEEALSSLWRTVDQAEPSHKVDAFKTMAGDVIRFVDLGIVDKRDAVDELDQKAMLLLDFDDAKERQAFLDDLFATAPPDHVAHNHERTSRIRLVPFDEIKVGTEPPTLVRGLIPRVGLTVVWGPPKSGKSFWVSDIALHVALAWDYRERRVIGGPAVYCAFEGHGGLAARIEAFRQRFLTEEVPRGVPFYLQPVTLDLVAEHRELIAAIAAHTKPVLVVLDTLNRSLRGSENSDEDMSAYVKAADAIREAFDCAVVVVHHSGTEGTRPRGHTSLTGAADAQIAVKRDQANNVVATVEWMKDGPEGDEIASRLEVIEVGVDQDGNPITSCVVVPADVQPVGKVAPRKRPGGRAALILDAVREAVADMPGSPAPSNHIPAGVAVTERKHVAEYARRKGFAETAKVHSFQAQLSNVLSSLAGSHHIGVWKDGADGTATTWIWLTG